MLGSGFEALDPIRMFHCCHIVYDQQTNALKILANRDEQIRNTIESIENAVLEFKASNSVPLETYVVYPPDFSSARKLVGIRDGSVGDVLEKHKTLYLCGEALTPEELSQWEHTRLDVIRQSQLKMQSAMIQTFNRICFHRGKVQMRVQFGRFTVNKLFWGTPDTSDLPLQQFLANIDRYAPEGTLDQL